MTGHIGFTGTRGGTTIEQFCLLENVVSTLQPSHAHHGDCEGADDDFDGIMSDLEVPTTLHPPLNEKQRAFCYGPHVAWVEPAEDYLVRDDKIVEQSELLIAAPAEYERKPHSGTWYTAGKAHLDGKLVLFVFPKGDGGIWYPGDAEIFYCDAETLLQAAQHYKELNP